MSVHHFNDLSLLRQKLRLKDHLVRGELSKALNKAGRESVNLSVDEWNAFSTTSSDYIKGLIYLQSGATAERLVCVVHARDRATRGNNFRYRKLTGENGVHLNVKRGAGGRVIKNAFVVNARSDGKPLILERLQKYQKGEGRNFRKNINGRRFKAVYGPSPNQHFHDSRERVAPKAISAAKQQFLRAIGESI